MTRFLLSVLLLFGLGAAKLPIEHKLSAQDRSASGGHLRGVAFDFDLREQAGQFGCIAALSGFRSIVADVLFLQAHVAWEKTQWGRVLLLLNGVTTLQPRSILFWDMAAWHIAWNASTAALNDQTQPRLALRIKAQREYFALGKDLLERGIRNNPEAPRLYESLARLYKEKYHDHERASEFFAKAAALPGAASYDQRFYAYELSHVEGREREAYELLLRLYHAGEKQRAPTLVSRLKFLEDKLGVPRDQRIPDENR